MFVIVMTMCMGLHSQQCWTVRGSVPSYPTLRSCLHDAKVYRAVYDPARYDGKTLKVRCKRT